MVYIHGVVQHQADGGQLWYASGAAGGVSGSLGAPRSTLRNIAALAVAESLLGENAQELGVN